MIPSYKNSTKAEKVVGWILLVLLIIGWVVFFTQHPTSCVNDPFYDYACAQ